MLQTRVECCISLRVDHVLLIHDFFDFYVRVHVLIIQEQTFSNRFVSVDFGRASDLQNSMHIQTEWKKIYVFVNVGNFPGATI